MLRFFESPDFGYWSTGTINPADKYYFDMPEKTPQWAGINLSLRDSAVFSIKMLPANLISPIPMNIEFMRLYAKYSKQCGEDFNRLFVPFRCVCSDVYHKRKIVCSSGSLGDAVRASMSFPLVFKPIKLDGVLVYDGGIYDNFPVDVMRKDFKPDFIIGVSVSSPDSKPEAGDIYSQLEDMIIQNNDYSLPADEGVKIQVPVLDFGVLDFGKAQEIYSIGYKTGLSMVDSIKSRVSARRKPGEVNARREVFAADTPVVEFDSVEVSGASPSQSRYIKFLFDRGATVLSVCSRLRMRITRLLREESSRTWCLMPSLTEILPGLCLRPRLRTAGMWGWAVGFPLPPTVSFSSTSATTHCVSIHLTPI